MESIPGTQVDHGPGELLRLTCVPGDTEDQVTAGNLAHIVSLVLLTPPDGEFLAAMARQRPLPGLRLSTRTLMNELALLAGGASLATYKAEYNDSSPRAIRRRASPASRHGDEASHPPEGHFASTFWTHTGTRDTAGRTLRERPRTIWALKWVSWRT